MGEDFPILTEEEKLRYYRKVCAKIASMLIKIMAEVMESPETVEKRLGKSRGFFMRYIRDLTVGKVTSLKEMTDIALALGVELEFEAKIVTPYYDMCISNTLPEFDREHFHYIGDKWDTTPFPEGLVSIIVLTKDNQLIPTIASVVIPENIKAWSFMIFDTPQTDVVADK